MLHNTRARLATFASSAEPTSAVWHRSPRTPWSKDSRVFLPCSTLCCSFFSLSPSLRLCSCALPLLFLPPSCCLCCQRCLGHRVASRPQAARLCLLVVLLKRRFVGWSYKRSFFCFSPFPTFVAAPPSHPVLLAGTDCKHCPPTRNRVRSLLDRCDDGAVAPRPSDRRRLVPLFLLTFPSHPSIAPPWRLMQTTLERRTVRSRP